ncbi:hypothetical protein ACET3X_000730 [Alternaria dauci]|uniref:Uncharacterized protein n=1 Tax=Alternaria dauci TaxID=48095 RepID=A0ABR3UV87_9PLEO
MPGPPAWVSKYIKDVEQHGPLPVGIHVVKDGDTARYQIIVNNNRTSSLHHPLSSEGREEWKDVMSMAREEEGSKADFPGCAHPPLVYKPGEWLWKRMDGNVVTIMIRALQMSGINVATEDFRNQKNKDAGDVLREYGQYITADDGYGQQNFHYDPGNGSPSSPTLTFHELTRWIIASDEESSAKRHAKAWDEVIMTRVTHRETPRLSDWDKFIQAAAAAQLKK